MAAMPAVGSATLSAAMGLRAASTQSSMDVMTAENIAAALPELTQPLPDPAGRWAGPLAPGSSAPSGKPPAFPQVRMQKVASSTPRGTASSVSSSQLVCPVRGTPRSRGLYAT